MDRVVYLALGDSLTEGVGAERMDCSFAHQFFEQLSRSDQCVMRNWGISGLTSGELFHLLQTSACQRLLPSCSHISVTIGGGDFIDLYRSGLTMPKIYRTMNQVIEQVSQSLEVIRKYNPEGMVYVLGYYIPRPAYDIALPLASYLLRRMNRSMMKICKKYQGELVDPFDSFYQRYDYFADDVHPNQMGYDALAALFARTAVSLAQQEPSVQ
ncbi:GDSL-type esterase/lipase family protein [Mechercharimyces sp. CAU 1602]|uniref:SGNH/GDSL hydrolase family protein n=1 Tax=Mechercharimyces sp. CAU 1602 TaxID=2973933 RepID=UPI0021632153|nr:GDSL-type esterase/lipase family protein [Mechercharimyces sp. CAU 1602]MCS1350168.1 GDSL-type esterase/lipase family protein [Mechercharimyces sp. CAU 1602]